MNDGVHVVPDATSAWATDESTHACHGAPLVSFWYNPSSKAMTLGEVVRTIQRPLRYVGIAGVTVRGLFVKREDFENHFAADHLRDGESFIVHQAQPNCTLL